MDRTVMYLICEQDIVTQAKRYDKERENREELGECIQDVRKHDNVDSETRKLSEEQHQLDPCQKYGSRC